MADALPYTCPRCRGPLASEPDAYRCDHCSRTYPVVCGVADFRLEPDPYIGLDDDRAKATHLFEASRTRTFEQLVRYYYSITPDDPPDLAEQWTRHHLAETEIADALMLDAGLGHGKGRVLLDLGCSTGGLVVAASRHEWRAIGIDVALRWLIVGRKRLEEAGVPMTLVCANAEHLPLPDGCVDAVTASDLLEHSGDPAGVLAEARRVSAAGATTVVTANNRFAPLPEPQLKLWGVTHLPRRWQARFVAWRRPDVHRYRMIVPSGRELRRWLTSAGFEAVRVEPAPLVAPHWGHGIASRVLTAYNAVRRWPLIRPLLLLAGPRLWGQAVAPATRDRR